MGRESGADGSTSGVPVDGAPEVVEELSAMSSDSSYTVAADVLSAGYVADAIVGVVACRSLIRI